ALLLLGTLAFLGIAEGAGWSPPPIVLVLLIGGLAALLISRRDRLVKDNLATWWALAVLVGFSVQLFLLIRSQQMPAINEGMPATFDAWKDYLLRKQYGPSNPFDRRADLWYQITHMYFRYVGEQWRILDRIGSLDLHSFWVRLVNMLPFAFAFLGAWWNAQRDKKTFWFFVAQNVIMGPFLIFYLNFTDHEVRERDYFFTNSYHFIAIWIGMGAAAFLHAVSEAIAPSGAKSEAPPRTASVAAAAESDATAAPLPAAPAAAWIVAIALVGFSALPARAGWFEHDRSNFWIAQNYAYNMLAPLAPNSIVMTNGDNDTFPLWYIQEVEGFRKDVRVVNMSLLNTPWYILQLKNLEPKVPFNFTDKEIEKLYPYLDEKTGQVVWVKDLAVKDMIAANAWRKPVYLAVTVPDQLGLERQMTLEGLVYRISPQPTTQEIDLDRTLKNLYEVFKYRGLLDANRNFDASVYKDENAMRLVQNYSAAHVQAAYQLQVQKRAPEAIKVLEDARKISPDFPGLLEYLGRLYDQEGDAAKAESYYRQGLERFPNSPEFYFHLGTLAYRRGSVDEAVQLLRRATQLSQQYFDWYSALFTVLWQSGQREEAVEVLRSWYRAHPEDQQTGLEIKRFEDSLRIGGSGLEDQLRPSGSKVRVR
ncbi:MAG TPA: tetratricopeptide repeat protein, partial [Candidatus Eisenbacteria bacterium]